MILLHDKLQQSTVCPICKRKYWKYAAGKGRLAKISQERSVCLECAKWLDLAENHPDGYEVIDGVVYKIFPKTKKTYATILGGNGVIKCVIRPDGTGITSNDVWTIGKVPERFLHLFPNTGWWIPSKYKYRTKYVVQCKNKTCFDRYHCIRYDYHQEFAEGPLNVPPLEWIVGDEKCPAFINILDVRNYNYFDTNDPMLYET